MMTLTDDDLTAIVWRLEPIIVARLEPILLGVAGLTAMCEVVDKGLESEHSRWQASALEMAPGLSAQQVRDAMRLASSSGAPAAGSIDKHLDDILVRTNTIGAGTVTVVSPVATSGDVAIDRGYDYYAADGRALRWTDETPATWPNLTGATATFYCGGLVVPGTISNPTGPATITVQLSRTQTAQLALGARPFHVDVTLANGHVILQIRGMATMR